jgi:hypothetical protein
MQRNSVFGLLERAQKPVETLDSIPEIRRSFISVGTGEPV